MLGSLMLDSQPTVREPLVTEVALQSGIAVSMGILPMLDKVPTVGKAALAELALVWLHSHVCDGVPLELELFTETRSTNGANKVLHR